MLTQDAPAAIFATPAIAEGSPLYLKFILGLQATCQTFTLVHIALHPKIK